jgi:hypothetical protein
MKWARDSGCNVRDVRKAKSTRGTPMDAGNCKSAISGFPQALGYRVVKKGGCGDFIFCDLASAGFSLSSGTGIFELHVHLPSAVLILL